MSAKTLTMKLMFRMMGLPTCEEVDQLAYDFLEGGLDSKTTRQLELHLKTCKNCQRFMASYRKMRALGKSPLTITLHPEFKEKMLEYLSKMGGP